MEGNYEIYQGEQRVGTAEVSTEGLYYNFYCRCVLSGETMCRIIVTCDGHIHSLGLPVPEGDAFVLRTRMPVKRLGQGQLQFRVIPKHTQVGGHFIPISPEEPFRYLSRLENAVMQIRDGKPGIFLGESVTDPEPD